MWVSMCKHGNWLFHRCSSAASLPFRFRGRRAESVDFVVAPWSASFCEQVEPLFLLQVHVFEQMKNCLMFMLMERAVSCWWSLFDQAFDLPAVRLRTVCRLRCVRSATLSPRKWTMHVSVRAANPVHTAQLWFWSVLWTLWVHASVFISALARVCAHAQLQFRSSRVLTFWVPTTVPT